MSAHCSATTLASSWRDTPNRSTRIWPSCCSGLPLDFERDADLARKGGHAGRTPCRSCAVRLWARLMIRVSAVPRSSYRPNHPRRRRCAVRLDQAVLVRVDDRVHAVRSCSVARIRSRPAPTTASSISAASAISAFERPRATSRRSSTSSGVSSSISGGRSSLLGMLANSATIRHVTLGTAARRRRRPCGSTRRFSSGGVSFRRNPLAPARRASKTYSSRSNVAG